MNPVLKNHKIVLLQSIDIPARGVFHDRRDVDHIDVDVQPERRDVDGAGRVLAAFAAGLAQDQAEYGMHLVGGDMSATPGPVTIAVMVFGETPPITRPTEMVRGPSTGSGGSACSTSA